MLGLVGWLGLVVVTVVWGRHLLDAGHDIAVRAAPLYGRWRLVAGWRLVPAVVLGAVVVLAGPHLARTMRWRRLLAVSAATTMAWATALAFVDGAEAITRPLESRHEYLPFARQVDDIGGFVETFVERLPSTPIHVQGHPPGTVIVLAALDRVGLAGAGWVALLVLMGAATAIVATLILCRALLDEGAARSAAPYLVALPAAVWMASTVDAIYAGVAVGAMALTVTEVGREHPRSSALVAAGVLLAAGVHFSYGLALLAPLVAAVVWHRRRPAAMIPLAAGALGVTAAFGAAGFWWWEGLRATHDAYVGGVASQRPLSYFVLGNLGAVALALGPVVVAGIAAAPRRWWILLGPVAAAVAVADVSGLSKGEVERIWLFLVVPLAAGAGVLAHRRAWLMAHVLSGLVLAAALRSPW